MKVNFKETHVTGYRVTICKFKFWFKFTKNSIEHLKRTHILFLPAAHQMELIRPAMMTVIALYRIILYVVRMV